MSTYRTGADKREYKVFIVDDHSLVREGLTQLVNREKDLTVCGEAGDISTAQQGVAASKPDIVIVDLTLEDGSGVRLIENLDYGNYNVPVLVLSMHDELIYAERCLKAGARGYIMKQEPSEKVISAIRKVLNGELYISEKLSEKLLHKFVGGKLKSSNSVIDLLSNREFEVYQLIGKGHKR